MVRSNGFCFLHVGGMVLYMDNGEMVTVGTIECSILDHLASNVNYYKLFPTGKVLKGQKETYKFFSNLHMQQL